MNTSFFKPNTNFIKRSLIKIILSVALHSLALQSTAQNVPWYQPGHEWFYKSWCSGSGSPGPCGYSHYTVESEVVISGEEAISLLQSTYDDSGELISTTNHFFRTSGDSVFHYYAPSETWYLLYSFNTPVGESWIVQDEVYVGYGFEDDLENWRFEVVVDSITTEEIGGLIRRRVHTSPWPGDGVTGPGVFYFSEGIIEGIGAVGMEMFGEAIAYVGIPGSFSCFIEDEETIYGPFGYPCTILNTEEITIDAVEIFPNPARNEVTIRLPNASLPITEINILDISGKVIFIDLQPGQDAKLILPNLHAGMYLLTIHTAKGSATKKLLVE